MIKSIDGIRVVHTNKVLGVDDVYYGGKIIKIDRFDDGWLLKLKHRTTQRYIIVWR